jgi:hypothetical protein
MQNFFMNLTHQKVEKYDILLLVIYDKVRLLKWPEMKVDFVHNIRKARRQQDLYLTSKVCGVWFCHIDLG